MRLSLPRLGVRWIAPGALAALAAAGLSSSPAAPQPADGAGGAGWVATYRAGGGGTAEVFAVTPIASLGAEAGESVHPFIPPEGFVARYNAAVTIPSPGRYRFGADFEGGTAEVSLTGPLSASAVLRHPAGTRAGLVMGNWVTLPAGVVQVRMQFRRTGGGPARFRAMWAREGAGTEGFAAEPIPASAAEVPPNFAAEASAGRSAFRGRVLLSEMGCVHCHDAGAAKDAILTLTVPDLKGVGQRVGAAYLARWIADPQALKPGCGMPDFLPDAGPEAGALAHFLLSLAPAMPPAPAPATEPAVLERGRTVYRGIGCVACHGEPDATDAPAPFGDLRNKWRPDALSSFLRDPLAVRHSGRMPSLLLSEDEADAVANYLLSVWGAAEPAPPIDAQKARAGQESFSFLGCVNCHVLDRELAAPMRRRDTPLARLRASRGCLNPRDTATPRYALTDSQRADIAAAIEQVRGAGGATRSSIDAVALRVRALGCVNCHEWHGEGGVRAAYAPRFHAIGEVDLGDEGRLPPRLGGVGGKLTSAWLREVLTEGARARPYMHARMPLFGGEHAAALVGGLARFDGVWPDSDSPEPRADQEMAAAGRALVGAGALNCIECHVFGERPPSGTPGPDITAFAGRLRYDWWQRYIRAPDRFKPGTRMPTFYAGALGAVTSVFGGDPARQADAMWTYFNLGAFMPEPDGLASGSTLLVQVRDRPIVLRTFLKDAGSRGIAVGFPSGLHFAYDAEKCRLADAWKGPFLDASGAWANRGGTEVGGQGPRVWSAPEGPAVALAAAGAHEPGAAALSFDGYTLDAQGVPTFSSSLAQPGETDVRATLEERFEPSPGGTFRRAFSVRGVMEGVEVWINTDNAPIDPASMVNAEPPQPRTGSWRVTRPTRPGEPMQFVLEVTP